MDPSLSQLHELDPGSGAIGAYFVNRESTVGWQSRLFGDGSPSPCSAAVRSLRPRARPETAAFGALSLSGPRWPTEASWRQTSTYSEQRDAKTIEGSILVS